MDNKECKHFTLTLLASFFLFSNLLHSIIDMEVVASIATGKNMSCSCSCKQWKRMYFLVCAWAFGIRSPNRSQSQTKSTKREEFLLARLEPLLHTTLLYNGEQMCVCVWQKPKLEWIKPEYGTEKYRKPSLPIEMNAKQSASVDVGNMKMRRRKTQKH